MLSTSGRPHRLLLQQAETGGNVSLDVQKGLNRINLGWERYDGVQNMTYLVYEVSGVVPVLGCSWVFDLRRKGYI